MCAATVVRTTMVATRASSINASHNDMPISIITMMTIFADSGTTTIVVIAHTTSTALMAHHALAGHRQYVLSASSLSSIGQSSHCSPRMRHTLNLQHTTRPANERAIRSRRSSRRPLMRATSPSCSSVRSLFTTSSRPASAFTMRLSAMPALRAPAAYRRAARPTKMASEATPATRAPSRR